MTADQFVNFQKEIDWGLVTAIIALVLAFASLIVQRKHNRLSFHPIGEITPWDYEGDLKVVLENKGTGPLIIDDLHFYNGQGEVKSSIVEFFTYDYDEIIWDTFVTNMNGNALSPGDSVILLELKGDQKSKKFINARQRIRIGLSQLKFRLTYKDIYENQMPAVTGNFLFFARSKEAGLVKSLKSSRD